MSLRLGIAIVIVAAALSWADMAAAADNDVIRIAGSAWVGDGPTKVATELDLFNKDRARGEPLIEVLDLGSGLEAMEMLMRGEVDFALAATTPVALALIGALEAGVDTQRQPLVLASLALSNQTHKLFVHPDTGISEPAELRGRRVGIMRGTSSHYGWWQFAAFHQLDDGSVELVDLRVREMAQALLDDRIDAALIWEPWDHILAEALGQAPLVFELRMLYTVNWLLLAERDFALANPALVERVLRAYRDTIAFMDSQPERALALHAQHSALTVEELHRRRQGILWRLGMNWSVLVNLGAQFEWLATWPELAGRRIPEPGEYLYGAALGKVAPQLVTLPSYLLLEQAAVDSSQ